MILLVPSNVHRTLLICGVKLVISDSFTYLSLYIEVHLDHNDTASSYCLVVIDNNALTHTVYW
jgi:hypothetical protein